MSLAGVTPTHACNLATEVQRREGELHGMKPTQIHSVVGFE